MLPVTDLTSPAGQDFFLQTVLHEVLHGLVLLVRVSVPPEPDTVSAVFLQKLSTLQQIVLQPVP